MYAVLKQDIISAEGFHALADKGRVYYLGDIVAILAMSSITDAGVDATICMVWHDAAVAYRVLHMERDLEWEGDEEFPWEPVVASPKFVGEAAARAAALAA